MLRLAHIYADCTDFALGNSIPFVLDIDNLVYIKLGFDFHSLLLDNGYAGMFWEVRYVRCVAILQRNNFWNTC